MNDKQPQGGSIPLEFIVVWAIVIAIAVTITIVVTIADPFHLSGA
ncbi:hypothetical protein [Streptomyces antnestii]|nr:hypothetical protein [Streptomyces sp. San01]